MPALASSRATVVPAMPAPTISTSEVSLATGEAYAPAFPIGAGHSGRTICPVRRAVVTLPLMWLMGVNLRTVIFGIPPALPELRHDLGLSYSASGAVTSVVLATLGLGSVPGAVVGARLGAQRTVTFTSIGLGLAAAARLLPPQIFWVFAGTIGLALC